MALYIQKFAGCLALLPKLRGDEESWSVMMQKILVVINDQLDIAFQGLEEGKPQYPLEFPGAIVSGHG